MANMIKSIRSKLIGGMGKKARPGYGDGEQPPDEARASEAADATPLSSRSPSTSSPEVDSPDQAVVDNVIRFCQSSRNDPSGDEIVFLPAIVDVAESSPGAAAACARTLRKLLGRAYHGQPGTQYHAIVLTRILVDNPGPTFTRNLDKKFADTVKELLRGRFKDSSVRDILYDTLNYFEKEKSWDEGLKLVIEVWAREKAKQKAKASGGKSSAPSAVASTAPVPQPFPPPSSRIPSSAAAATPRQRTLPPPEELASRLEEGRTSAKLLTQVVVNTPASELIQSELVSEFVSRCSSALRDIQAYMVAEYPAPPDLDTSEALIDAAEQLQASLNYHQRAVLSARKHLGLNSSGEVADGSAGQPDVAVSPVCSPSGSSPAVGSSPVIGSRARQSSSQAQEYQSGTTYAESAEIGSQPQPFASGANPGGHLALASPLTDPNTPAHPVGKGKGVATPTAPAGYFSGLSLEMHDDENPFSDPQRPHDDEPLEYYGGSSTGGNSHSAATAPGRPRSRGRS